MWDKIKMIIGGEAFRYVIVGGCTTLVNIVLFGLLCYFTPLGETKIGITVGNVISIISSILFAYITNKVFVFRSKTDGLRELLFEMGKFVGARLGTMAIEVGGVWLIVSVIEWNELVGKLLTQVVVIIGNYFISKFIVFKGREK